MHGGDSWGNNPYDDEDDLGAADVAAAVFGPESLTQTNRDFDQPLVAQQPFGDQMNGVYPGFPLGNPPPALNEGERRLVNAVALQLARMLRNTNVTTADPAHVTPNIWSDPVDLTERVTLQAAAHAPNVWQDGIVFTVPPGFWARFFQYGYTVNDDTYTYDGSIEWRIIVQNVAVPTLQRMTVQRGSVIHPRDVFFKAEQDQVVKFQLRRAVAAPAAQDVDLALLGWAWRLRNDYDGTRASVTAG